MSTSTHHDTAMPVRKMDVGFFAGMPLDFFCR